MALLISAMSAAVFVAAQVGGEQKSKLPQLDVQTFPGQLFWLAVTFGLLFLLLTYVVIPRIGGVLAARQGKIGGDLAAATDARSKADDALKAYDAALAEARNRSRAMADETRNAMRAGNDKRRAEAEAKLGVELAAAEARIAGTKSAALANIRGVAAETAAAIVERLSGEPVTASDAASAVDSALGR